MENSHGSSTKKSHGLSSSEKSHGSSPSEKSHGSSRDNKNGHTVDNGHSSKTESTNTKLQQFNLEERNGSLDEPIDISKLTSRNCHTIDFTPSGAIASSGILNEGSDDEENVSSKQSTIKTPSTLKGGSKSGSLQKFSTSKVSGSSSGAKLTPLEKQVVELKAGNPGVLLLVEVGYKYKFFGEDAEVSCELLCCLDKNFVSINFMLGWR